MYYNYEEPIKRAAGHRILALNRGEKEKVLTVKIAAPEADLIRYLEFQQVGIGADQRLGKAPGAGTPLQFPGLLRPHGRKFR